VVVASQHAPNIAYRQLRKQIIEKVVLPVLPKRLVDNQTVFHINPTGRFVIGGPNVDTYGGRGSHGGGAFSGKDPTKVDRTASYMARYIAKNVVAADLAEACEIQLSYAIGVADPISVLVDTEGTSKIDEQTLSQLIRKFFPLTPKKMVDYLNLARPIFAATSYGGHFGRKGSNFTWENTDRAAKLRKAARL
jgi:S-adenosylmethionine synthetase